MSTQFCRLSAVLFLIFTACLAKPKNVVIILADDLGWADVSFHGGGQIPTPNIDLLASSGVVLNNYYVLPLCSPSRSALLTGLHPIHTGMQVDVIAAAQPYGLPTNFTTLGEHFRKAGYATHLVGKWHQGFYRADYLPTRRGFDTFFGFLTGHSDFFNRSANEDGLVGFDFYENEKPANLEKYRDRYSTDMYTDRAVEIIRAHANEQNAKPFVLCFAQQSVHTAERVEPIQPPPRYQDHFKHIADKDRRNFAGMVAALDDSIGRVFAILNETGVLHETIIVFSTDNGGVSGGRNGQRIYGGIGSNHPLKGGKFTLWEGGVRGTAFLWSSDLKHTHHVSQQLLDITDLLPTLYRGAVGHKLEAKTDGQDYWQVLSRGVGVNNDRVLLHNIDNTEGFWAIRWKNFKLTLGTIMQGNLDWWYRAPGEATERLSSICYNCSDTYKILKELNMSTAIVNLAIECPPRGNECNSTELCLFDLSADPCEGDNIAANRTDVVTKLLGDLEAFNRTYAEPNNKPSDPLADPALHGGFWSPWVL